MFPLSVVVLENLIGADGPPLPTFLPHLAALAVALLLLGPARLLVRGLLKAEFKLSTLVVVILVIGLVLGALALAASDAYVESLTPTPPDPFGPRPERQWIARDVLNVLWGEAHHRAALRSDAEAAGRMAALPSPEEKDAAMRFAAAVDASVVITEVREALDRSCEADYTVYQPVYDPAGREIASKPVDATYLGEDGDIRLLGEDLVAVQFAVARRVVEDGDPRREFGPDVVSVLVRRIPAQGWGDSDLYVAVAIVF